MLDITESPTIPKYYRESNDKLHFRMEKRPFFSIVTASLNNASTIRNTLDSIENQVFRECEHIVVDGGSRDDTVAILEEYEGRYDLRWTSESDDGISDALNKGIQRSNGKYVVAIQTDDYLTDRYILDKVFPLLEDERLDIYSCPVIVKNQDGRESVHKPNKYVKLRYHFKNVFRHQGSFVHRRLNDQVGLFREDLLISMDYEFFYCSLKINCHYLTGTEPIAVMRRGGINCRQHFLRILEEMRAQDLNEDNVFWRAAQILFRSSIESIKHSIEHALSAKTYRSGRAVALIVFLCVQGLVNAN